MYRTLHRFGIAHLDERQAASLAGRTAASDVDGLKRSDASKRSCTPDP